MSEAERLQNAINLAVWHLERGETQEAMAVLQKHYNEKEDDDASL